MDERRVDSRPTIRTEPPPKVDMDDPALIILAELLRIAIEEEAKLKKVA